MINGKKSTMTGERIMKLTKIDFVFDASAKKGYSGNNPLTPAQTQTQTQTHPVVVADMNMNMPISTNMPVAMSVDPSVVVLPLSLPADALADTLALADTTTNTPADIRPVNLVGNENIEDTDVGPPNSEFIGVSRNDSEDDGINNLNNFTEAI